MNYQDHCLYLAVRNYHPHSHGYQKWMVLLNLVGVHQDPHGTGKAWSPGSDGLRIFWWEPPGGDATGLQMWQATPLTLQYHVTMLNSQKGSWTLLNWLTHSFFPSLTLPLSSHHASFVVLVFFSCCCAPQCSTLLQMPYPPSAHVNSPLGSHAFLISTWEYFRGTHSHFLSIPQLTVPFFLSVPLCAPLTLKVNLISMVRLPSQMEWENMVSMSYLSFLYLRRTLYCFYGALLYSFLFPFNSLGLGSLSIQSANI